MSEGEKLLQYIDESQDEIIEKICIGAGRRLRIGVPPVAFRPFISAICCIALSRQYPDIELEDLGGRSQYCPELR